MLGTLFNAKFHEGAEVRTGAALKSQFMELVKQGDHKPTGGTNREPIVTEVMKAWDAVQRQGETETLGSGEWEEDDDEDEEFEEV